MSERLAMTVGEFAEAIGVTRNTVFNWIKRGQIKSTKIGGTRLIDMAAYHARMNGQNPTTTKRQNVGMSRGMRKNDHPSH